MIARDMQRNVENTSGCVVPRLANTKIPAMTSVQECKSEDTGVGPSIASGNQSCEIEVTDLNCIAKMNPKST